MRAVGGRIIDALPRNETLKRGAHGLHGGDRLARYQDVLSLLPGPRIDQLFHPGLLPENAGNAIRDGWADLEDLMGQADELGGLQFIELRSTLPDELLMYTDKLSMAHGLEVRVPYLDREVVEYVEQLPANLKVRYGRGKWLHRRVAAQHLPHRILRRKKRGFAVNVVDSWFRGAASDHFRELLLDPESRIYAYLHRPAVVGLWEEHQAGRQDNHKVLFSTVMLEHWLRQHQGGDAFATAGVA
jgi:asparagine synthase (glutamine-hydrolysing)